MARGHIFAVTADGKVGSVREGSQQFEKVAGCRLAKLLPVTTFQCLPVPCHAERTKEFFRGCKFGQPRVEVPLLPLGLGDASGEVAYRTNADAFAGLTGFSETYDMHGHQPSP